jgi:hypothetical protein
LGTSVVAEVETARPSLSEARLVNVAAALGSADGAETVTTIDGTNS